MMSRIHFCGKSRAVLVASLFCFSGQAELCNGLVQATAPKTKARAAQPASTRTKIAEGLYAVVGGKAGQQNSYREPWTLYKTALGYELREQWMVTTGNGTDSTVDVAINFAAGLYPIEVQIGSEGSARRMLCSMALKEFKCTTGGAESKLAMQGAYNVFLPSPWMLGSIARRAKKVPGQSASVQLVMMAGSDKPGPKLLAFPAQVQYVGEDSVSIGGEKIAASIFELKAQDTGIPNVSIPGTLIWTSTEGVVLALQDSDKPEQRIELVQYKKYGKF
jgi:hypothetical protein